MAWYPGSSTILPLIEFLRPSRSPHLVSSTIGTGSVCFIAFEKEKVSNFEFFLVSVPVYLTLFLIMIFSFRDKGIVDPEEDIENQFRFSRALGIGSAILAMGLVVYFQSEGGLFFYLCYFAALAQLITFVFYSLVRLVREESKHDGRLFQISFMMFVFLIVSTYCFSVGSIHDDIFIIRGADGGNGINRAGITGIIFGILWLTYEIFWILRIYRIVEFRIEVSTNERRP